jgi:hypothetical protein
MKYLILFLSFSLLRLSLTAQYVQVFKADSVKITGKDSCELIIENHTQGIPGFLYNKGRGRTEFRRAFVSLSDSTYQVGPDTLTMPGSNYWRGYVTKIYNANSGNVGIHRTAPVAMLDLPGAFNIDDTSSYQFTSTPVLRMDGLISNTYSNLYLGPATGAANTGRYCTYLGPVAGGDQVAGDNNTVTGAYAGAYNMTPSTPAGRSTFVGAFAAENNSGADLTAVGIEAADQEGGSSTIAVGNAATQYSSGKVNCVFIGDLTATSADLSRTSLSTYIGGMAGAVETGAQNNNTLIGASTSIVNAPTVPPSFASDATAVGYQATVRASNTIVFGDASVRTWLFNTHATTRTGAALIAGYNSLNGNGAYLSASGVWTNASDRAKKEHFTAVDVSELLGQIAILPVTRWNYTGLPEKHIGPMAQDFQRIFELGQDDKTISTIDPSGIALAGIQGLYHRWQQARSTAGEQQEQLRGLAEKIATQNAELAALLAKLNEQDKEFDQQDTDIQDIANRSTTVATSQQ